MERSGAIAAVGVIGGLLFMSYIAMMPRGFRNKNPLNIEYSAANDWVGQTGHDGRFSQFTDMKYGIRAAVKIINRYRNTYGLITVSEIINRWAPDHENPTNAYAEYVADRVGVHPVAQILTDEQIPDLVAAMIRFECGRDADMSDVLEGCRLAGVNV